MVHFLTLPEGAGHIDLFIDRYDRSYSRHLVELTYQNLLHRGFAPSGTYIFTDRGRMNPCQRRLADAIRFRLAHAGPGFRVIGNTIAQAGRWELLERLANQGVNNYRVYMATNLDLNSMRYPVFVRMENDHMGPRSELLETPEEVTSAIARLVLAGFRREHILVVEFVDVRDHDGLYRKYGSFRIGSRIICQHILHSNEWLAKRESTIRTPELIGISDQFFDENPHRDILMPIFELAGIEYGRIDYGFARGRIQVWEINDNPMFVGRNAHRVSRVNKGARFFEAFRSLDVDLPQTDGRPISLNLADVKRVVED